MGRALDLHPEAAARHFALYYLDRIELELELREGVLCPVGDRGVIGFAVREDTIPRAARIGDYLGWQLRPCLHLVKQVEHALVGQAVAAGDGNGGQVGEMVAHGNESAERLLFGDA